LPQDEPQRLETEDALMLAARAASDRKATEIVALDLREVASFTEFFLICTGANPRQVQAISDAVEEGLRKRGKRPLHTEGYSNAEWILLDYGDFIVHVFGSASRRFYDLERLWRDAKRVEIKDEG
ncbi:MAG TPA: ribosome silencing factor, partial [Blastocatellia bacterium]|nr:ribosome silencing factor [Blastocatellia bacterium]